MRKTSEQDHNAHHPDTNAAAPSSAPSSSNAPGGMGNMMGGDMERMMPVMMQMMQTCMTGGGMTGIGMPEMGPPMARGTTGLRHVEGQLAFYQAELHITDAQTVQWNAFADAIRTNAKRLQEAYRAIAQPRAGLPSLPDQLARRRQLLTAELDSLQSTEPAGHALYAALSAEQKKAADELMADHLRRM